MAANARCGRCNVKFSKFPSPSADVYVHGIDGTARVHEHCLTADEHIKMFQSVAVPAGSITRTPRADGVFSKQNKRE